MNFIRNEAKMKKNFCHWFILFMISILTLACVLTKSPSGSGHLVNYSSLRPDPEVKGIYTYQNPRINPEQFPAQYTALTIDPIIVYFHRDAIGLGINPEELKSLMDYFRSELVQTLKERYLISDTPGAEVLRIRLAIADVAPSKPRLTTHPAKTAFGLDKASLEAEFLDSKTGERMAAVMDTRKDDKYLKLQDITIKEHAKSIVAQWIGLIKERLDTVYGAQEEPPSKSDELK